MQKEFKSIRIEITYTKHTEVSQVDVRRNACIEFGVDTTFSDMDKFFKNFKRVISAYKHCAKIGTFCKVYLSISNWERASLPTDTVEGNLKQLSFRGWYFEDVPMAGDVEGLHLNPDTRYTEEQHDIYIDFAEPLLRQLAQANI